MVDLIPLQFGLPGGPELLIILLIAVLLFGANKIPKLARSTGEAMGEFQKGREEVEQELQEMRDGATGDTEDAGTSTTDDEEFEVADAESETDSETDLETDEQTN
jgi:sec-independent protein translocase protein TatA